MVEVGTVSKLPSGRWVFAIDEAGNPSPDDYATAGDAEDAGKEFIREQRAKVNAPKTAMMRTKGPNDSGPSIETQQAFITKNGGRGSGK